MVPMIMNPSRFGVSIPIALDTIVSADQATGTTFTTAMTVAANSNKVLIACIGYSDADTISGVVWGAGSEAFTKAGSIKQGGLTSTEIWYLINPTAETGNIVATATGSIPVARMVGLSFYNCDQSTGVQNYNSNGGTAANSTISVTPTVEGSWCIVAHNAEGSSSSLSGYDSVAWAENNTRYMEDGVYETDPTISSANTATYNSASMRYSHSGVELLRA